MEVYFDAGVLVKIYTDEPYSERAIEEVEQTTWIPLTQLNEIEIKNALRAKRGRNLIPAGDLERSLGFMREDIADGRLRRVALDAHDWYRLGEELSRQYTENILCRAVDILHVAAAHLLECRRFVTGDARQAGLAKESGLQVTNIMG